jgi:hypothetical protein
LLISLDSVSSSRVHYYTELACQHLDGSRDTRNALLLTVFSNELPSGIQIFHINYLNAFGIDEYNSGN